ncbi:hypothetical protein P9112_012783 [Eukaryota sp. TZLM1-RC]
MRYDFQLPLIGDFLQKHNISNVGLQFPEGLLVYAFNLSTTIEDSFNVTCCILGDDCYGACCIDDRLVESMSLGGIIHFGHSQLFQSHALCVPALYVKAVVQVDTDSHLPERIMDSILNHPLSPSDQTLVVLTCTTQFTTLTSMVGDVLTQKGYNVSIPQASPNLSYGECLGCTVPRIPNDNALIIYIGDGRFHLEALAMHNPDISILRYDPFTHHLSLQQLDVASLKAQRKEAINKIILKETLNLGLVVSTLGRQGSDGVCRRLSQLAKRQSHVEVIEFSVRDISSSFVDSVTPHVDALVIIGCPRLPLDWGTEFDLLMLTTHEAYSLLSGNNSEKEYIPMDNFSVGCGPWANLF